MSKKKVLLVGWDAADWKIVNPLMDAGLMPATRNLVENGVMANIMTLNPVFSPMLWTSIATGKRPCKHGIYGFSEVASDGKTIQPVTNLSRKTKALWNIFSQQELKSTVVGWWPSSPAEPINGVMVSNHYQRAPRTGKAADWKMPPGTVHPPRLEETLKNLRFHPEELELEHILPFIPDGHRVDQTKDSRIASCMNTLAHCTSIQHAATFLMEEEPWDFMAVYFDAIDHFCHGFMKYHPPQLPWVNDEDYEIYQNVVSAGYVYHDMMLARLVELAGPDAYVILMSDHGFHPDHLRRRELPNEPAGPAAEHREHGIFVMSGPGIKKDTLIHGVNLLDVAPTVLTLFGLPAGEDMDGRVLTEAFETAPEIEPIPSWDDVPGEDGSHPPDRKLDSSESREGIEQLVALGYIEAPGDDQEVAIARTQRELDYNLALAYIDGGLPGEAAPILYRLYVNDPLEFRFGIRLAICLQRLGHVDDLSKLIDDLNGRWRKASTAARGRLSEIREIANERREARKKAIEAAGDGIPEDKTESKMGRLFNQKEMLVVKKIRALAKGNPMTLDYLAGWVAMSKGDFETAIDLLEKADESQSKTPGFHIQLGEAYRELKRHDQAHACYQRALDLDPHNAAACLGWARSLLTLRQNAQAMEMTNKALSFKFHAPVAHYCLGMCQMRNEQFDDAIKSFQTAVELNPNFPEAYIRLARIYRGAKGDELQAREYENKAAELKQTEGDPHPAESLIPDLPPFEGIDYEDVLPKFPEPSPVHRFPPLGADQRLDEKQAGQRAERPEVVVVSGLPRSGTSAMMQMLQAGGVEILTDAARVADENNPRGYLELEKVKKLQADNTWLNEAHDKALKVVSPLVSLLPLDQNYRLIVMQRSLDEILDSQGSMLTRLERDLESGDREKVREFLEKQHGFAMERLQFHGIPTLVVEHRNLIDDPAGVAQQVCEFIGSDMDVEKMAQVIDPTLHRERAQQPETSK